MQESLNYIKWSDSELTSFQYSSFKFGVLRFICNDMIKFRLISLRKCLFY